MGVAVLASFGLKVNNIQIIGMRVIAVIAEFILDPDKYEKTAGQTQGQTGKIDRRKTLLAFYVSDCR